MKVRILLLCLIGAVAPAFADEVAETQKVVERKTCAEISAQIANLSEIVNPDETVLENLKQLQTLQRRNCVAKNTGRRTVARTLPVVNASMAENVTESDALSEYLANKKSNCDKLNDEIEKMASANDDANADALASMRGVYDMDCAEKSKPAPAEPEQTYEEWAAAYDANLAAGLCGDGSKPNKYGCCPDEIFKDLGNTRFACCPKTGGDCFPPIK